MLELLLAFILLVVLPTNAVARDLLGRTPLPDKRQRYLRSITIISVLLAVLYLAWHLGSRGLADLGLVAPTTPSALAGCAVAAVIVVALAAVPFVKPKADEAETNAKLAKETMPETSAEIAAFLVFVLAAGFGWEILYRGFLLFWLTPIIGVWPAVAVSGLAYGLTHGCKSVGLVARSVAMAVLFAAGFAVTGNLWWLIALHVALPLTGLMAYRRWRSRPACVPAERAAAEQQPPRVV